MNTAPSLDIVISAYRLPRNLMDSFIDWNSEVFQSAGVALSIVLDHPEVFQQSWVKPLVYPKPQVQFSLPKTVNYGLRRAQSEILVKSDIDIIFSKEVIAYVKKKVKPGTGMICICSNLVLPGLAKTTNWLLAEKRTEGRGACFALHRSDWEALNGYNEEIYGWGADDNDMYDRARKAQTVIVSYDFPLYHVNHPERKTVQPGSFFEFRSEQNLRIGMKPWKKPSWGQAED